MSFTSDIMVIANSELAKASERPMGKHLSWLDTWFNPKNAYDFLAFRNSLGDEDSIRTFDLVVKNRLGQYLGGDPDTFNFFSDQDWINLLQLAKGIDCIKENFIVDEMETFVLESYNYKNLITVEEGDHVLDCGAYTGNTALYFSRKAGDGGKIHAFEPVPETYKRLKRNIDKHNMYIVQPHNFALLDAVKDVQFVESGTSGAKMGKGSITIPGITIDEFVLRNNINRIDFIKMDIEGAEIPALKGAIRTCRKFKPDLAICVYHKETDFIEIPKLIREISPNYSFYLKHNSNSFLETVLFAQYIDKPQTFFADKQEATLLHTWWTGLKSSVKRITQSQNKAHIKTYAALFADVVKYPVAPVFDPHNLYVFYPVSSDNQLHFEFIIAAGGVSVGLHFEGPYKDKHSIMEEICTASRLNTPLRVSSSFTNGCVYNLPDAKDYRRAVDTMAYLVRLSLPILSQHKLISDEIYFGILKSPISNYLQEQ